MVLLSGTRDVTAVVNAGRNKVEALLQDVEEEDEEGEKVDPTRSGVLAWRGAADPLPQLLAAIPAPAVLRHQSRSSRGPSENAENEEDYEEYDDFSDLPDTRSIASDDSFYPPDVERRAIPGPPGIDDDDQDEDEVEYEEFSEGSFRSWESVESPEPLSLFRACCTNNPVVLKALIRQGVSEAEVQDTDRNHRMLLPSYEEIVEALERQTLKHCARLVYYLQLNPIKSFLYLFY
ncbi:hypothetical protein NDU88_007068 [Pleurodeles waltl]|uniref:Uncharacterized protein n=1 Tax=Pleurodeles waltl TaxID=8319 RepID=A0AAV7VTD4_PLEWA|nr:hypothetical protein NDU88_007068 [Pleurodeles waltl]